MNTATPSDLARVRAIFALRQCHRTGSMARSQFIELSAGLGSSPASDMFFPAGGTDVAPVWLALRVWYAFLHTVVEGWRELALANGSVDVLIETLDEHGDLERLRRFRNFVFHYQADVEDWRGVDLLTFGPASGVTERLNQLHLALGEHLDAWHATTDLSSLTLFDRP